MAEGPTRLDLARQSYAEVLDATKHQDDKVGRLLATIAFLTAGALAFVNRGVLDITYQVGRYEWALLGLAFGAFLIFVALTVLSLLLVLATPLTSPSSGGGHRRSHLYFYLIANETEKTWTEMWGDAGEGVHELLEQFEDEYVDEAYNLAVRADHKYAHTSEAAAFFVAGMVFFTLAVVLSTDALVNAPPVVETAERLDADTASTATGVETTRTAAERPPLEWSSFRRWLVGGTLAAFSGVILYRRYRDSSRQSLSKRVARERAWSARRRLADVDPAGVLAGLVPLLILVIVPLGGPLAGALVTVLGSVALVCAMKDAPRPTGRWMAGLVGVTVIGFATWSVAADRPEMQLGTAVGTVLILLGSGLLTATARSERRVEAHRPA